MLATVSDKKLAVDDGTYDIAGNKLNSTADGKIDYYEADVVTANDYYPGGMQMPGRKYTNGNLYRYGFNGKENDNEVKGEGNQQDYGMRIYDGRLGRFLSVDPITDEYPELTPYQFASNSPINGIDLDGEEHKWYKLALDEKTGTTQLTIVKEEKKTSILWGLISWENTNSVRTVEYNDKHYSFVHSGYSYECDQKANAYLETVFNDFVTNPEAALVNYPNVLTSDEDEFEEFAQASVMVAATGTATAFNAAGSKQSSTSTNSNSPSSSTNKQTTAANKGNTNAASSNTASSSSGRSGKQARIKAMKNDPKESSANRGWVKNEERRIASGNGSKNYRMPNNGRKSPGRLAKDKGLELAHPNNASASKGNSYQNARVKNHSEHKVETRIHKKGGRY